MSGWIKLQRKMTDWEWFTDVNTCHLFTYLLLSAAHTETKWRGISLKPGQLVTGRIQMASKTGLSEQQVRTSLDKLRATSEITSESTNNFTVITITNWNLYQDSNQPNNQPITSQPTNDQPANQPTDNHIQEGKENKNEKKEILSTEKNSARPRSLILKVKAEDLSEDWLVKELSPPNVIEMWNEIVVGEEKTKQHVYLTNDRRTKIQSRTKDSLPDGQHWLEYFQSIASDSFCMGEKGWKATIDWALRPASVIKMKEGGYSEKKVR